ncbi:MAG: hypothetical protein IKT20_03900 [Clostridiales bacterium]|nr:hypothetical protein [Clostridiales bacterium]MBR6488029.1 hypothetical protein [Clostridiales bacterium]
MKARLFGKTTAIILALASSLMLFSGCGKKIYSDPSMTTTIARQTTPGEVAYNDLATTLSKYDAALNDYMHTHMKECKIKEVDDKTFSGTTCHSRFTVSPDDKYRVLQQEKKYEDKTVMDEYFDLKNAMFIARTTIYTNGDYEPVEKYYIANNMVYKLDYNTATVYKVVALNTNDTAAKQKQLDMYFSFDEIMAKYGT